MKESLLRPEVDPRRIQPERPTQGWQDGAAPRITRSVLSDQVSKVIVDGLLSGRFQPGDRLVESDLAALLGVSRSPIREALTELAQSGVVECAPGRGCRIRNWSVTDLEELFAVRGLLEGYAGRLACTRFGREEKAIFARILADMQSAGQRADFATMIDLDLEFHFELWKCSGNRMLFQVLEAMSQQFRLFLTLNWKFRGGLQDVAGLHKKVIEALASGNPAQAEHALHQHVRAESVVEALKLQNQAQEEARAASAAERPVRRRKARRANA